LQHGAIAPDLNHTSSFNTYLLWRGVVVSDNYDDSAWFAQIYLLDQRWNTLAVTLDTMLP
jgi:hypothetical protein